MGENENQSAPSEEQLQRLTGKILLDSEFRQSFLSAPQQMAQSFDPEITLTAEQVEVIASLDHEEIENYAEELIEEIGRVRIAYWLAPMPIDPQGGGGPPIT
jgi:hypothetical protein